MNNCKTLKGFKNNDTYNHLGPDVSPRNYVLESEKENFYVSYNWYDKTTALVWDKNASFFNGAYFVLNGDHRTAYSEIVDQGFDICKKYFDDNIDQKNKHSDTGSVAEVLEKLKKMRDEMYKNDGLK